jgi:hypothetical protein
LDLKRQKSRNPLRRERRKVSGLTFCGPNLAKKNREIEDEQAS